MIVSRDAELCNVQETVIEMASRGAKVITGCRDLKKAESVVKIVKDKYKVDVVVEPLDLADLAFNGVVLVDHVGQADKTKA